MRTPLCPHCEIEMVNKGTVRSEDLCGSGCCRSSTVLFQCPKCKEVLLAED